jgi:beta-glucosidase
MLFGHQGNYSGWVPGNARLGIPELRYNDGPQGADARVNGTTTAWPSTLSMASSFDPVLIEHWGRLMGNEFFNKGANVQLGPGACLARFPGNGRNFEYIAGEDPYLGFTLVQPLVRGIQSQTVIATVKHFINNQQEYHRFVIDEHVDERTEMELYFPTFLGAAQASVGAAMCSYNLINGVYACEQPATLLKYKKMGFGGTSVGGEVWGGIVPT